MNIQTHLPILSGRLALRPFEPSDRPAYDAYHTRPEVYRFLYAPVPNEDARDEKFTAAMSPCLEKDGDTLRLAVIRLQDSSLLGEVLLKMVNKAALQAEVGYIFNPDFAGKGYATEAVRAMIDLGFGGYGFHRIFARLDPLNAGSVGVVERLKMRKEAHLIQNDLFGGIWGDEFIYARLRSEWEARESQHA